MTMRRARVLRLATAGPQDTAPLAAAIARGEVDPATIVAIVGKTEGNGCVNDFTRGYATLALKLLLAERCGCPLAEVEKRVAIVMSGGTEGGLSPHLLVFCRDEAPAAASAPGVALALNEIERAPESAIGKDWSLYSRVASTSAGVELLRNEIVVLGNAAGWAGDLVIGHDVMKDAIDADAARRVLAAIGG